MTDELARLIVYVYEFCGLSTLICIYYGPGPKDFDRQAAGVQLYNAAIKFLKDSPNV